MKTSLNAYITQIQHNGVLVHALWRNKAPIPFVRSFELIVASVAKLTIPSDASYIDASIRGDLFDSPTPRDYGHQDLQETVIPHSISRDSSQSGSI